MAKGTPQDVLKRVRRIAGVNGWSVAVVSGLSTLLCLVTGAAGGAAVGLMVTLGGVMELRGRRMLGERKPDGMLWLVRGQLMVLGMIWVYAVSRLASFDPELAMGNLTPDMERLLAESGILMSDILPLVKIAFYTLYITLLLVTLFYQGGLALYYRSRTAVVTEALRATPAVNRTE